MNKIVVCVKQVPSVAQVKIDPETKTLVRRGVPSEMNPFDRHAVEQALRTREQRGGRVVAVSMGPPQAEDVLMTCLGMGADEAILLCDDLLVGSDTLATSYALAQLVAYVGYDVIFCGQETTDSSTGQVPPGLAERLKVPQITYVKEVQRFRGNRICLLREIDRGHQVVWSRLPAVLAMVKGSNEPREIVVSASRDRIRRVTVADIGCDPARVGLTGSPTQVLKVQWNETSCGSFFAVPTNLPAHARIRLVMSGGVQRRSDQVVFNRVTDDVLDSLARMIEENASESG